uniref:Epsilon-sarcoglycan n=1 Tax=Haemonchus placei TaxID=6290 RepID=A0A158QR53_HAEPC
LKPDRDVHSSLSDEYKAKAYREAEKQKEKFAHPIADAYSPEYDILMILVTGVLIVLVVVAIFSVETAPVEEINELYKDGRVNVAYSTKNDSKFHHSLKDFRNYRHSLFRLGGANGTIVMPWRERNFSVTQQEELWHRFSTEEYPNMPPRRMKVSPALANYLRENKYNDKDKWIQRLGLNESIDFETQYFTPSMYFTEEHGIFAAEPATTSHGGYVAKMKNYHELSPDKKELVLTYALLRAQEAAYYTEANSLISDVEIERGSDSILKGVNFRSAQNMTKVGGDRVTTMFTVSSSLQHEEVFSVAMSRLHKSFNDSNGDTWAYPHFVEMSAEGVAKRSRPFTSMADVLLYRKRYDNTTMFFSFVSVSGSIRTVEAAASVSVRMLIEEKTPAEAIRSPAALYDPRDNKFYCEHDQEFRERLYLKYKIVCEDMKTGDKEIQDRVVMAMKIQEKNVGYSDTVMTASVSRQPMEYNYPVGY